MFAERVLTLFILVFSIVFLVWIIPTQVETVDFGRIVPRTIPSITLTVLIITALVQLMTSKVSVEINVVLCIRAAIFVLLMVLAVWLMERYGFEYIAPILALSIMLLIGERRWYWLLTGGFAIPLGIWLIVEQLLARPLA